MIYKFTSKSAADHLMAQDVGERVLRIIGKDVAPKGIIEVADMPAALSALAAAVAHDDARLATGPGAASAARFDERDGEPVTLHQHVWPFSEMLKQAHAAGEVIVWGV